MPKINDIEVTAKLDSATAGFDCGFSLNAAGLSQLGPTLIQIILTMGAILKTTGGFAVIIMFATSYATRQVGDPTNEPTRMLVATQTHIASPGWWSHQRTNSNVIVARSRE